MPEMKPNGGIETGPGPDPGPEISFEMPAHEMCLEHRAVLSRLDGQSEYMVFTDEFSFMPDVVWIDGRKFKYSGVSDGRGFYQEIEVPPLSLQLAESMDTVSVCPHRIPHRYPCEDCDREDLELANGTDGSGETLNRLGDVTKIVLETTKLAQDRSGADKPEESVVFGPYDDTDNALAEWKRGASFFHAEKYSTDQGPVDSQE